MGKLGLAAGEGDRQPAGRVDVARQDFGDRFAALLPGIPGLDDGGRQVEPRHDDRPARLEHDHGARIGARHAFDQTRPARRADSRFGASALSVRYWSAKTTTASASAAAFAASLGLSAVGEVDASAEGTAAGSRRAAKRDRTSSPGLCLRAPSERDAAARNDLRRAASGGHAAVGVRADDKNASAYPRPAAARRRCAAGPRLPARSPSAVSSLSAQVGGIRRRSPSARPQAKIDVRIRRAMSSSRACGTSPSVDRAQTERPKKFSRVELFARFLIEAGERRADRRVDGAPVGHDEARIAPVALQDLVQEPVVLAGIDPVDLVVGAHDRARSALLDADLESQKIRLPRRRRIDPDVEHDAVGLLVVEGVSA